MGRHPEARIWFASKVIAAGLVIVAVGSSCQRTPESIDAKPPIGPYYIEATVTPGFQRNFFEQKGISIDYPFGWSVKEDKSAIVIESGQIRFNRPIAYLRVSKINASSISLEDIAGIYEEELHSTLLEMTPDTIPLIPQRTDFHGYNAIAYDYTTETSRGISGGFFGSLLLVDDNKENVWAISYACENSAKAANEYNLRKTVESMRFLDFLKNHEEPAGKVKEL